MKSTVSGPRKSGLNLSSAVTAAQHWAEYFTCFFCMMGVTVAPAVKDDYEGSMS